MIPALFQILFGNQRNLLKETAEVFRKNAEEEGQRAHDFQLATLAQLSAEFQRADSHLFDRLIDGVNRLPRPLLALGTFGLLISAMFDPVWFAARMQGLALVPDPLWWLLGVIVTFYFGARHQMKGQAHQTQIAQALAHLPQVIETLAVTDQPRTAQHEEEQPDPTVSNLSLDQNPALMRWHQSNVQA